MLDRLYRNEAINSIIQAIGNPLINGAIAYAFYGNKLNRLFNDEQLLPQVNQALTSLGLPKVQSLGDLQNLASDDPVVNEALQAVKDYVNNLQQLKNESTRAQLGLLLMDPQAYGALLPNNVLGNIIRNARLKRATSTALRQLNIPDEVIELFTSNPVLGLALLMNRQNQAPQGTTPSPNIGPMPFAPVVPWQERFQLNVDPGVIFNPLPLPQIPRQKAAANKKSTKGKQGRE